MGSIPGSGRSPGEGNGSPLQYSCLENPMDRGAWWAAARGFAKSQTRLSDLACIRAVCPDCWDSSCVYILSWCGYCFLNYLLIYSFLAVLGLCCLTGFSPVAASGGYSLVAVQTSHCSGLSCSGAQALEHPGFRSCSLRVR